MSEGPAGRVNKVVSFRDLTSDSSGEAYSLDLGDLSDNGDVDYYSVTANGDTEKILSTVGIAVRLFTDLHPHTWIYAEATSPARMRLYSMNLSRFLPMINASVELWGTIDGSKWETFQPNRRYILLACRAYHK